MCTVYGSDVTCVRLWVHDKVTNDLQIAAWHACEFLDLEIWVYLCDACIEFRESYILMHIQYVSIVTYCDANMLKDIGKLYLVQLYQSAEHNASEPCNTGLKQYPL